MGMRLETLLADRSTNSPADFARVAEAAAAAGFRSVAIWAGRIAQLGIHDARRILDDAGVEVKLAELVNHWADGPEAAITGFEDQLDTVEAMGAKKVLAVVQQTEMDLGRAVEGFAALCERAAQRGVQVAVSSSPTGRCAIWLPPGKWCVDRRGKRGDRSGHEALAEPAKRSRPRSAAHHPWPPRALRAGVRRLPAGLRSPRVPTGTRSRSAATGRRRGRYSRNPRGAERHRGRPVLRSRGLQCRHGCTGPESMAARIREAVALYFA